MGVIANIKHNLFPKQGRDLNRRVTVFFHYDIANSISGEIVRDDMDAPFVCIIKLDDGRHVLATECQYSFI